MDKGNIGSLIPYSSGVPKYLRNNCLLVEVHITLFIHYLQICVKSKTSQYTKEVTENLDAKLLDLQKKSIPLSGSSATKSSSKYTPLT